MLKSLAARIVFAPKDFADAREISDELGTTTVRVRTVSRPLGVRFDRRSARGKSQSVSEQRRALLLPQEVKELGGEEAIVFYEGLRPIRCRKIRYFTDPIFRARLRLPPLVPKPAGIGVESPVVLADAAETQAERLAAPIEDPKKETAVIRDGTTEDIARLASLTLEDFAANPVLPIATDRGEPISDDDMKNRVNVFLTSLKSEKEMRHDR